MSPLSFRDDLAIGDITFAGANVTAPLPVAAAALLFGCMAAGFALRRPKN